MGYQVMRRSIVLALLTIFFTLAFPSAGQADPLVLPGFDLFETRAGTTVNLGPAGLQPFRGVPLGTFNFGNGDVAIFNTDTIVRRLGSATPGSPIVPIEMVALQLASVNQFNLGAGNDFHFVTLQSIRGGPASTGTITINFGPEGVPHGTFDSELTVHFDIRVGSLNGPIVFSNTLVLTASGVPWSHFPPLDAVLIPGVNFLLNGQNQLNDFFPEPFAEAKPDDAEHRVRQATIPEPTTLSLLAIGIAGVAARVWKRRKQAE